MLTLYNMKKIVLLFLLFSIGVKSQGFNKVDHLVLNYPKFTKVKDLAKKIQQDFSKDEHKVRAGFIWLTKNINYNLKEYYNPTQRSYSFSYSSEAEKQQKIQDQKDKIINAAFKTKKGVCEEYAQSFKKICDLLNIEAAVIKGNVKNHVTEIGKPQKISNHAWNAVKLNNQWIVLDATWAAGYLQNGKWIKDYNNYYYNIPKEKIFKTHLPEKSIWVLRFGRITQQEFYNQPIYGQQFLNLKTTLVSPKKGIVYVNNQNNIKLIFKNLDNKSLLFYTFKGNNLAKKPIIETKENNTILKIPNAKRNSVLNLFINNSLALQFKTK